MMNFINDLNRQEELKRQKSSKFRSL